MRSVNRRPPAFWAPVQGRRAPRSRSAPALRTRGAGPPPAARPPRLMGGPWCAGHGPTGRVVSLQLGHRGEKPASSPRHPVLGAQPPARVQAHRPVSLQTLLQPMAPLIRESLFANTQPPGRFTGGTGALPTGLSVVGRGSRAEIPSEYHHWLLVVPRGVMRPVGIDGARGVSTSPETHATLSPSRLEGKL